MGKAYSEDLRLKALVALDGGQTKMTIHKSFGIARSTLDDWIALREQQGHLAPVARRPRLLHVARAKVKAFSTWRCSRPSPTSMDTGRWGRCAFCGTKSRGNF